MDCETQQIKEIVIIPDGEQYMCKTIRRYHIIKALQDQSGMNKKDATELCDMIYSK